MIEGNLFQNDNPKPSGIDYYSFLPKTGERENEGVDNCIIKRTKTPFESRPSSRRAKRGRLFKALEWGLSEEVKGGLSNK